MSDQKILPILKIYPGQIAERVLVCGDPARAKQIAKYLESAEEIAFNREYCVINGTYNGTSVTIASHGVGAAGASVCFEELIKAGAKVLIRVGTAGSLDPKIKDGDLVIATGAVREDGMTSQLVPISFPAIGDCQVVSALTETAKKQGARAFKGLVLSLGAFYPGILPLPNATMSKAGVKAVEMEVSALYIVSALRGVKAGAIVAIDGIAVEFEGDDYNPHRQIVAEAIEKEIQVALEAIVNIK